MNATQSIGNECGKKKAACHGMPPPPVEGLASASIGEAVVVLSSK